MTGRNLVSCDRVTLCCNINKSSYSECVCSAVVPGDIVVGVKAAIHLPRYTQCSIRLLDKN